MGKQHKTDPKTWKIKRSRKGDEHIQNCASGYTQTSSKRFRQVHHVICVSSMADGTINGYITDKDARSFIRKCLAITEWDINAEPNCISLPLKPAYLNKSAPSGWDRLPCHQVDHNPLYTDAVSDHLNAKIWEKLQDKAADCEVKAETIKAKLEAATSKWRDFLVQRGAEEGGTKYCWDNQMKLPNRWYKPFSMAPSPVARQPVDYKKLTGSIQDKLKQLFQLH